MPARQAESLQTLPSAPKLVLTNFVLSLLYAFRFVNPFYIKKTNFSWQSPGGAL